MTYVQKNWQNDKAGGTQIIAEDLNRMEQGIVDAIALAGTGVPGTESVAGIDPVDGDIPLFTTPGGAVVSHTPEQHGASGDGSTDDTAAFQAAHDYVASLGGGVVKLTKPHYVAGGVVFDSGVSFVVDSAGQRMTGSGVLCKITPPAGFTGYMFDAALYQIVRTSGTPTGTGYTLTGGWGGSSTTASIGLADSLATIQTKVRALTGFGAVTVTADPTSGYRINMDTTIGDPSVGGAIGGSLAPAKLTVDNSALSGGTMVVTRHIVESAGFSGIELVGNVVASGSDRVGGIRARLANKFNAHAISGTWHSKGVIVGGGGAWTVTDPNIQNFAFEATPLALGALTLYGADHVVRGGEYAGVGGTTGTALVDSSTLTHVAVALHSQTSWLVDPLAELADVGIFVGGSYNVITGWRTDLCGAHGLQQASYAYGNQYRSGRVLSCGLSADNTYDGMHLDGIGHQVDGVVGVVATNVGTTNRMRYLVYENDTTTDALIARRFKSTVRNLMGDVNSWSSEMYLSTLTRPCSDADGGNPSARPPAKQMNGRHWNDSLASRDTRSDGTYWRNSVGEIVGNVLPESLTTLRATTGWTAAAATCTASRVDGHTDFRSPWCTQLVTTATGVTATYAGVSGISGTVPPVTAGRPYTAAVRALGPAGATVSFTVTWKDVGGSTISTTAATTPVAVSTTDTLALAAIPVVAPPTATGAVLNVICTRAGLTLGDTFKFARATLVAGTTANDVEAG